LNSVEPRAYLRVIRNVKRGIEARSIIISALRRESLTAKEVARRTGLSYATVRLQLRNLEKEGIVKREGKPPHQWRLTGKGQAGINDYLNL